MLGETADAVEKTRMAQRGDRVIHEGIVGRAEARPSVGDGNRGSQRREKRSGLLYSRDFRPRESNPGSMAKACRMLN